MAEVLEMAVGRVEWRRVGDEVVVLDLTERRYLAVNRSGAILWPMLDRGATRAQMSAALADAYDLPPETAGRDVDAFVADLERRGLLRRAGSG